MLTIKKVCFKHLYLKVKINLIIIFKKKIDELEEIRKKKSDEEALKEYWNTR